jgi:hypothetical protein
MTRRVRWALVGVLCGSVLRSADAQKAPPKVAPCDTAAVLLQAPPTFDVGRATITKSCATFASWLGTWSATRDTATQRVVGELLHGVARKADSVAPTPPIVAPIDSSVAQPGGYPHRPASFTHATELDFSQPIPSLPDDRDRPIAGSDWAMIYFGGNWTSKDGVWSGHWAPGAYGGGVIGQGGGHGIGNVFTYAPSGTNRLYLSLRVYFDFDASNWHPISNKFVNLEGDRSLILMQLMEGGNWRHAEELMSGASFFVDGGRDAPGEDHIAGQVDNRPVPTRAWTQIEILIDIPNHVYKIWQDGVLTTDARPTFASSRINAVGVYAFRGGGGETLRADLYYRYDHVLAAW